MKDKRSSIITRFAKKGIFPYQFAFTLLIPLRNVFLSPKKLIQRLELKENDNVLEVGAGPGYFSSKVAKSLKNSKLTLADIQSEMLDLAKKRLTKKKVFNVEYHLCNGVDFPFETNKFDIIYMVTVLGEIENKQQYVKEFYRLLCPNGIISISEQGGDPDKMSIEEIKDLLHDCGFEFDKLYGRKSNFTINFRKKS
ncbi:Methyltransferase type 11 [Alkaliphilus metalliredigens QYMF]|uniref:Methyltransferase type 11 n=1 Tax=Alkaliphilus metalliredigens (strain QYMF) TaxID=293826 RepID=A6TN71_ALKMQ|nr:methyltransferase domain-containing protein [Alkaliphilus metalliredigens]ABR47639.1 Methyltransferase type 11 [Alkaliphilus metalliredigens QYMF]